MDPYVNFYAPPKHDGPPAPVVPAGDQATALAELRRAHINAETNVKALGVLMYIGAVGLLSSGIQRLPDEPLDGAINLVSSAGLALSAYWLRHLDPRGRLVYSIVAGVGILRLIIEVAIRSDPSRIGPAFWPLLFLAILWSGKATKVMTPHYRDVVIPATPQVKRQTSKALVAVLVILVLSLVAVVVVNLAG